MSLSNRFTKINNEWAVCVVSPTPTTGDTVDVQLASGQPKPVQLGRLISQQPGYNVFATAPTPRVTAAIGDLSGILRLFATAKEHLKFPAIVMAVGLDQPVRISLAGEKAKQPGSLTVTSGHRDEETGRAYFGRVTLDGQLDARREAPVGLAAAIQAFAKDPAGVAAEHGRLTGRCCFCNQALQDERSTAVGYGQTCAKHFGLPWGARPKAFAEAV